MAVPTDRRYTSEHEWIVLRDDVARVGITEYAADALGDVVYVDLPAVDDALSAGTACGEIESTKSVSELFAPADGVVTRLNERVQAEPEIVNTDPYGEGWLFEMRVADVGDLLDAAAYEALTAEPDAR